jgi:hypothetical protein
VLLPEAALQCGMASVLCVQCKHARSGWVCSCGACDAVGLAAVTCWWHITAGRCRAEQRVSGADSCAAGAGVMMDN